MPTYFTDFAGTALTTTPQGWSNFGEPESTFLAAEDPESRLMVVHQRTGGTNTRLFAWKWDAIPDVTHVEVFCLFRVMAVGDIFQRLCKVYTRLQGSGSTLMAYAPGLHITGEEDRRHLIGVPFTPNWYEQLPSISWAWAQNDIIAMRTRNEGNTIQARFWKPASPFTDPTADEPATWEHNYSDTTVSTAGGVGIGAVTAPTGQNHMGVYAIGVGTDGDIAPHSGTSTSQLTTPQNFSFTAVAGQRQLNGSWDSVPNAATYEYQVDEETSPGTWTQLATANQAGTTFQLDNTDGVDWATTYRSRVRAHPPE